jgi:hypothetical protein
MDQAEIEILRRQLARANPPPILHRYRRPTEHTLDEIREHRIFAAMPDDLNDAFGTTRLYRFGYAMHSSRSHDTVIRVYDDAGNLFETRKHNGDYKEW